MKQRYRELSYELCQEAVYACFVGKWTRADILSYVEEYAGVSRKEIYQDEIENACNARNEAVDNIAGHLLDMAEAIIAGEDLDIEPVTVKPRPDGMTGKVRDIACLCIDHQLLGHLVFLGMRRHLLARILPQQHASIPGRGQTFLMKQTKRYLRKDGLGIRFVQKTDVHHAYASTRYEIVNRKLQEELPSAKWIQAVMAFLEMLAPGGSLIIGGYLDAWLFNYVMSYALRYVLSLGNERRGKFLPFVSRAVTYMDDVCLMARTRSGLEKAVKKLCRWMKEHLQLEIKATTGIVEILSVEEERRRKTMTKPSQRGCTCIDMGGYRIFRTHVCIRARITKRVLRTFKRAKGELERTGTIRIQRANAIIAYYGFIKQTNSTKIREQYDVDRIVKFAKKVKGHFARVESRKRKEWLRYAISRDPVERLAAGGC